MKITVFLISFLFWFGEIISQEYKWINHCMLYRIPKIPREKIAQSVKELCRDGRESHPCLVFRRLLSEEFKQLLLEGGNELRNFWNKDAVGVLTNVYQKSFPRLERDYGPEKTLYMFDPIDDDSMADYKAEFYKMAVFSKLYAEESDRKPNNQKLKKLSVMVKRFLQIIEMNTKSLYETSKWSLTGLGLDAAMKNSIDRVFDLNQEFKDIDRQRYNDINQLIPVFKDYVQRIDSNIPLDAQKHIILRMMKLYKGITRFCFEAILIEEYKKKGIAQNYVGMKLEADAVFFDITPNSVQVSYHWVEDKMPSRVLKDPSSSSNDDSDVVVKSRNSLSPPRWKPESSPSYSSPSLGKRHAGSSTSALEYYPAGSHKNLRPTGSPSRRK